MSDFSGFYPPKENYSKLPHQLIDELHTFSSLAELKVVLYVLRHTWGYQDNYKKITLDEFENGRKENDGTRIDKGVGMTKPSIIDGIKRAIEHGFLHAHTDETDTARVKKFYSLTESGLKSFTPDVKEFNHSSKESSHRTEKETEERNSEKETKKDSSALRFEDAPIIPDTDSDSHNLDESPEPAAPVEEISIIEAVEESASQELALEDSEDAPVEDAPALEIATEQPPDAEVEAVIGEAEQVIAKKPKKTRKPRERDRIWDGIAYICFNIDAKKSDDNPEVAALIEVHKGRINKINAWLKSLAIPTTPEELWEFKLWYKTKLPKYDFPCDASRFAKHFTDYRNRDADNSTVNGNSNHRRPTEADYVAPDAPLPANPLARLKEMAAEPKVKSS